jgi:hypothetical protein
MGLVIVFQAATMEVFQSDWTLVTEDPEVKCIRKDQVCPEGSGPEAVQRKRVMHLR